MTAVMMLANLLITPHYMNVPTEAVAALIPTLLLPFNLIKAILNAAIVLLLYKPLSNILKKIGVIEKSQNDVMKNTTNSKRSIVVTIISLAIVVMSIAIIFFVLRA
jgi:riboflavin transporter FmnP